MLAPETINEILISAVGVETSILLVVVYKLYKLLHDKMKDKKTS